MGLFGTLVGMIEIFGAGSPRERLRSALNSPTALAWRFIMQHLVCLVAIPGIIFYRHFRAKVDELVVEMELQALKLVEIIHGERQGLRTGERGKGLHEFSARTAKRRTGDQSRCP